MPPNDVIISYFQSVHDWPEGLQILCSKFSDWLSSGNYTENVWTAFVQRHEIESLRILLASGLRLNNKMWSNSVISRFSECTKLVLDTIASDCKNPPANCKHCTRGFDPNLLLHCAYLDRHMAEKVFAANIQGLSIETKVKIEDIDTGGLVRPTFHGKFYSDPYHNSRVAYAKEYTPIFRHALDFLSEYHFDHILSTMKLLEWFVGKGARYSWIEPWTSTTPAHLIGSCLLSLISAKYQAIRDIADWAKISLEELTNFLLDKDYPAPFYLRTVSIDHTDNCNCACSQSGCIPILGAVKVALWPFNPDEPTISQEVLYKSLQVIEEPLSRSLARRSAVTRTITFERLGIQHTCHDVFIREDYYWRPGYYEVPHGYETPDERMTRRQEETSELHEEDSELINRLEDLMIEFEAKLADHTGTFIEFFSGYWTTRMNEVDEELSIVTEEHKQAIREAGVVICPTFGPELPPDWEERNRVIEVE
ncbi:hypothetical protein BS50DRAFT_361275 [Corynespora cassiicola Philippines]|uniref:Uncharacterized protein n=1 Tax=Corynespora cassiicola Philippines TaxID=1448308 RepID=A0A2T2NTD4_CORCC|nr:hypothetical protein BS50DRAFT_361275 [Corynespora cassiicola Philippines]